MDLDVRIAALRAPDERRLRLAAPLLAAHGKSARVSDWDGTRCHAVAVAADDAYGRRVLEAAVRRQIPVLVMSGAPPEASGAVAVSGETVAGLVATLNRLGPAGYAVLPGTADAVDPGVSGLLALAGAAFKGRDVRAIQGGRSVTLRPSSGRVSASSLSDLLSAQDAFVGGGWSFQANPSKADDGHVFAGLEAFLLRSALKNRERLPAFADDPLRLRAWPDLGGAAESVVALRVAASLRRAPHRRSLLTTLFAAPEVNACLWAFAASNLLTPAQSAVAVPPPKPAPRSALGRIAARFGLWGSGTESPGYALSAAIRP